MSGSWAREEWNKLEIQILFGVHRLWKPQLSSAVGMRTWSAGRSSVFGVTLDVKKGSQAPRLGNWVNDSAIPWAGESGGRCKVEEREPWVWSDPLWGQLKWDIRTQVDFGLELRESAVWMWESAVYPGPHSGMVGGWVGRDLHWGWRPGSYWRVEGVGGRRAGQDDNWERRGEAWRFQIWDKNQLNLRVENHGLCYWSWEVSCLPGSPPRSSNGQHWTWLWLCDIVGFQAEWVIHVCVYVCMYFGF